MAHRGRESRLAVHGEIHQGFGAGHQSVSRVLRKLKQRYYWPELKRDVNRFIIACDVCDRARAPNPKHKVELGIVRVGAPMEQLAIDIIGGGTFQKATGGCKYILSIIDHYTKWAVAVPMQDQTTETVAQAVLDHWVTTFGVPMRIHSDRGLMFEAEVFHALCRLLRIQKTKPQTTKPSWITLREDTWASICGRPSPLIVVPFAETNPASFSSFRTIYRSSRSLQNF